MQDEVVAYLHEWRFGSRRKAQEIAERYVAAHADWYDAERVSWFSRDGLVKNIEDLRLAGQSEAVAMCEMYALAKFGGTQDGRLIPADELPVIDIGRPEDRVEFEHLWRTDRDEAKSCAMTFVSDHREQLVRQFSRYTLEDLVVLVESYREAGREDERLTVEMWLLGEYKPQQIEGAFDVGAHSFLNGGK